MEIIFTFWVIILSMNYCFSQDTIKLKSNEDISSKVLEVTTSEIKYKRFDNPNGPTYTIPKSEVFQIFYENGTKDIFIEQKTEIVSLPTRISTLPTFYVEKTKEGYEQPIIDKLLKLKKVVSTKQEISDYTIKCIISKNGGWGVPAQGSIMIIETKSGNSIVSSKTAKAMVNMFRGFQDPKFLIMREIAKDYLPDLLIELKIK